MQFLSVSTSEQELLQPKFELGDIIGQLFVGIICDRMGRKVALVSTTLLIVLGATLATAAHGVNGGVTSFFWFLTVARGITGVVSHSHFHARLRC